jgi:hypothetical protein
MGIHFHITRRRKRMSAMNDHNFNSSDRAGLGDCSKAQ